MHIFTSNWDNYFSDPERQKKESFESLACTNFARNNAAEPKLNYKKRKNLLNEETLKFCKDDGYINPTTGNFDLSDRALAYWSGTTKDGNRQKNVNDAAEEYGSVPEKVWPFPEPAKNRDKVTWDQYYKEPPQFVYDQGEKWKIYFDDIHEWERKSNFNKRIKESPIIGFVYAWFPDDDGIYYRPDDIEHSNHAIVVRGKSSKKNGKKVWTIRETYPPFDKWVYDDNLDNGGYLVDIIDKNNLNIMEFVKKHDQKLIRNKETGQYGAIYRKTLYKVNEDRAGLFMIDREARGVIGEKGMVSVSDKTWRSLPQKEF